MGWMDLSEYALIEGAARDRVVDLLQAAVPRRVKAAGAPTSTLARVLYVASALRVQPRATDYLGDRVLHQRSRREGRRLILPVARKANAARAADHPQ